MPSPIPSDLARERGQVLNKALRELPLELLEALLRGVRRHADSLAPGALHSGRGGCAVGMMLHELRGTKPRRWRIRWRSPTIHEDAPELANRYPRLGHLELIFDRTCEELAARHGVEPCEVARDVGLWMAAEVQAEIDSRRARQLTSARAARGAGAAATARSSGRSRPARHPHEARGARVVGRRGRRAPVGRARRRAVVSSR